MHTLLVSLEVVASTKALTFSLAPTDVTQEDFRMLDFMLSTSTY
jgi:hypothetical protein